MTRLNRVGFALLAAMSVLVAPGCDSHQRGINAARPTIRTRFVVSVSSYMRPRWSGLIMVDPVRRRCTNVALPGSPSYITFSGRRYAYSVGPRSYRVGTIGGPPPRRFRTRTTELPYWLDGHIGLASGFSRKLHLGVRTVNLDIPRRAQVGSFVASRGRIAFQAWWGNARAGSGHSAIFVYAYGGQRKLPLPASQPFAANPTEYDLLGWSPDGSRLVLNVRNNFWTVLPDGTQLRPLTHFAPSSSPYQGGSPLWSPDGRFFAFVGGGEHSPPEVYVVRTDGGTRRVRRLTHSRWSSGPYGQQNGTMPLTWLSSDALAAAHQFSIGILGLDGSFRPICRRVGVTFWNGTSLRATRRS